jgi:hypothetical protein
MGFAGETRSSLGTSTTKRGGAAMAEAARVKAIRLEERVRRLRTARTSGMDGRG